MQVGFDEGKMQNILHITALLTNNGQRELALDLLAQSIHHCELEAQGKQEEQRQQLQLLKAQLEQKYAQTMHRGLDLTPLGIFALKTAIVGLVSLLVLIITIASLEGFINRTVQTQFDRLYHKCEQILEKEHANPSRRIRFLGLLTHNPAVHYRASIIKEQQGYLKAALEEMELAMGLVAPDIQLYRERLQKLRTRLALQARKKNK